MSKAPPHPTLPTDARVCLLQPAFLGDVVLSTAVLESWHRQYPEHRLSVLVRSQAAGFFEDHPFIDQVYAWDKQGAGKYVRLCGLAARIRKARPDVVINLHRYASMALIARATSTKVQTGFSGATRWHPTGTQTVAHALGDGRHETERNHSQVASFLGAWDASTDRPRLHLSSRHTADAGQWPTGALILAPSSVWATKRWPEEHWQSVADGWAERMPHREVILMGAAGDRSLLQRIASGCRSATPRIAAGELNLMGAAALMAQSAVVVSNDSAPLHMAGAVDTPAVGVFCSTTPRLGFGVLPGMLNQGRALNVEIAEADLACKPCGPHGHAQCPLGHFKCGQDLVPKKVWEAAVGLSSLPSGSRTL